MTPDPFYETFTRQLLAWQADYMVDQQGGLIFSVDTRLCKMPLWLREQHPLTMAIIFEHRVWDLDVRENEFEFMVTFNHQPATIVVPYTAIRAVEDRYNPGHPYERQSVAQATNENEATVVSLAAWRDRNGK